MPEDGFQDGEGRAGEVSEVSLVSAGVSAGEAPAEARRVRLPGWWTTVTGNLYLVLGTLVFGLLALPAGPLPPRGDWVFSMSKLWSWGLLAASGVRVRRSFRQRLAPEGGYIFLANHQSMFDIPLMIATVPVQLRFAAKRSLFRIPVFGWAIRAGGFIPVDRGDRQKARNALGAAQERLGRGTSVLLFPEGSRSLDGLIHPFQRGGLLLALKTGLPIVPVGIRGTLGRQRRGSFKIRGGGVEAHYGTPIDPADYGVRGRREMEAELRRQIEELAGTESSDVEIE